MWQQRMRSARHKFTIEVRGTFLEKKKVRSRVFRNREEVHVPKNLPNCYQFLFSIFFFFFLPVKPSVIIFSVEELNFLEGVSAWEVALHIRMHCQESVKRSRACLLRTYHQKPRQLVARFVP